jgi:hypothetical protein
VADAYAFDSLDESEADIPLGALCWCFNDGSVRNGHMGEAPAYVTEMFPTAPRAIGLSYQIGAAVASVGQSRWG